METLRQVLLSRESEIKCTLCGQCCPDGCSSKTPQNTCSAHPALSAGAELRDDFRCAYSPVELLMYFKFACPPVMAVITALTGEELEVVAGKSQRRGQYFVYASQVERLLNQPIE